MTYPVNASKRRPKSQQSAQLAPFLAPSGGVNAISNLAGMPTDDCVYSYNMVPGQYGLNTRDGYIEWCTNVGTGGVNTVIPYSGSTEVEDTLFACAANGIYDVSASTNAPPLMIAFPVMSDESGFGIWQTTTNAAGAKFLCYCDEENGYYVYTESAGTWAKITMGAGATQVSGVDPATFAFVMSWKNRLWFIQKNTGTAWYLAAGALFGAATKFEFGNKFKYGGTLKGLYNWTVDGGIGVDDYLVGVSSAGDVIVYQGTDPSVATSIDQRGTYYIGPPPAGRRIAGAFGGDLFLLSSYGLIPITKLLSGQTVTETNIFVSAKITPLINTQMALSRTTLGWEVKFDPTHTVLIISSPKQASQDYLQFAQSTDTKGWGVYRKLPYITGDSWQGLFYTGDDANRVLVHTGPLDNVLFNSASSGDQVEWSLLTSFNDLGTPAQNKVAQFIRPTFIAERAPGYSVKAIYDYNLIESTDVPVPATPFGDLWDIGIWDSAIWGGQFVTTNLLNGGSGMGRSVAIAIKGVSATRTTFVRVDLSFTFGNVL